MERKSKTGMRIIALLMMVGIMLGLPVAATAAGGTAGNQNLVIEKTVTAPAGHEALADRYQFTLALWNTDPAEEEAKYTVRYYKDKVATGNLVGTSTFTGKVDSKIPTPNLTVYAPEDYETPGTVAAGSATTISADETKNIVNVVYAPKPVVPPPTPTAGYTVNYYRNAVGSANFITSTTGSGNVGSTIPVDTSYSCPAGFTAPGTIAAGSATTISENPAANVVNVVYTAKTTAEYTILYYYNDSAPLLAGATPLGSTTGIGNIGDSITFDSSAFIPAEPLPIPYRYQTTVLAESATTISDNSAANIVWVIHWKQTYGQSSPIKLFGPQHAAKGTGNPAPGAVPAVDSYLSAPPAASVKRPQPISDACMATLLAAGHDIVKLDDSNNCAMYQFTLAPGQTLDIYGLPANTGFIVTEVKGVKTGPLDLDSVTVTQNGAGSPKTTKKTASGMLINGDAKALFHYVRPGKITVDPDKSTPGGQDPNPGNGPDGDPNGNGPNGTKKDGGGLGGMISDIIGGRVPLGALTENASWSLLNLFLALLGIAASIVLAIHYFITVRGHKKKDEEDMADAAAEGGDNAAVVMQAAEVTENGEAIIEPDEENADEKRKKRWQVLRWVSAVAGVLQVLLFLILEDIRLPMVWITRWTPLFLVVAVIQFACLLVFAVRGGMMRQKNKDEDEDAGYKDTQSVPT